MSEKSNGIGMTRTYLAWTLLCIGCMVVMLRFAFHRTIVIEDAANNVTANNTMTNHLEDTTQKIEAISESVVSETLLMSKSFGVEGQFYISLPKGIRAENVIIENRYAERELWLHLTDVTTIAKGECEVSGDIVPILQGVRETKASEVILKLQMNRIYEYRSTLDNDRLTIAWNEPAKLYDCIVVIEPAQIADNGELYNEITLQVADRVREKLAEKLDAQGVKTSKPDVKVYLARREEGYFDREECFELAEEVAADLYVKLSLADTPGVPDKYGITGIYNSQYYIDGFGNPQLTDLLTKEVTIASGNKANGLVSAPEDSVLSLMKIPACEISMGYLSNPKENYLLNQAAYRDKLADGIVKALTEAIDSLREGEKR